MTRPGDNFQTAETTGPCIAAYETPYPLKEAVRRFFPAGGVTDRSLRTEHRNGNLAFSRLVPKRPRRADAELALRLLRQRFATFCFADAATNVRRQELAAALELWQQHHGARSMTASTLHDAVKAALDLQERGRQYVAQAEDAH